MGERVGGGIFGRGCGIGGWWIGSLGARSAGEVFGRKGHKDRKGTGEGVIGKREKGKGKWERRGQDGEREESGKMYRDDEILVMQTLCLKY